MTDTKAKCNTPELSQLYWSKTIASGWLVINCAVSATSSGIFCQLSVSMLIISSSDGNRMSPDTSDTVNSMVRFSIIFSVLKVYNRYFSIFSLNDSLLKYWKFLNFLPSFPHFPDSKGQMKVENLWCHELACIN